MELLECSFDQMPLESRMFERGLPQFFFGSDGGDSTSLLWTCIIPVDKKQDSVVFL